MAGSYTTTAIVRAMAQRSSALGGIPPDTRLNFMCPGMLENDATAQHPVTGSYPNFVAGKPTVISLPFSFSSLTVFGTLLSSPRFLLRPVLTRRRAGDHTLTREGTLAQPPRKAKMNELNEHRCTEWLSAFCVMLQQRKVVPAKNGSLQRDAEGPEREQRGFTRQGEQHHG